MSSDDTQGESIAQPAWYCLACGSENLRSARFCIACGRALRISEQQEREGVAFLLNELEALREEGDIDEQTFLRLRERYREELGLTGEQPEPVAAAPAAPPAPPVQPAPPARPAAPKREGPGWLAEQQASLLLYLGAFLIVIATLIFVGRDEEAISGGVKMALLIVYTVLFTGAGLFCLRIPRVQQAGVAFFAIGALLVPLNFVGAYAFFFADDEIDPTGLWLAGSLTSALFYGAVSMLGMGRWYPVPMITAILSSLAAVLVLADAAPAAYPGSFIALAFVLAAPSVLPLPRVREVFGLFGSLAAHGVVPLAFLAALAMAGAIEGGEASWLAASLMSVLFYGAVSLLGLGRLDSVPTVWYPAPMAVALLSSLGAVLVLADATPAAYPGSFIALAFVLAAPSVLPLRRVREVFGHAGSWAAHLVVPLAFLAALAMVGDTEGGEAAWLTASLSSALFYGAVALLGLGRLDPVPTIWYPAPMAVALLSSLGAVLVLADAPPEAYPGSFIALALLMAAPSVLPLGRVSEVFGPVGSLAAHAVVPLAFLAALAITPFAADGDSERAFELATRWYLPPTAALAALFYWTQAPWVRRAYPDIEPIVTVAALTVTGGAALTLVYALDVGRQWYGPAVAIVGWLYAGGSEGFGPRWFGQRYLGWLALGAITVSWLPFVWIYADFPRHGAGVHFAAVAFYLSAARLVKLDIPLFQLVAPTGRPKQEPESYRVPAAVTLMYAAGLTLGIGFYHLLASLPAAETAEASDLALAFFGLSLGVAAVAATMRWWWPDMRLHVYAIALGMSLFVLLGSVDVEGRVALLLAVYTGVALALALWEREPLALALPAAYGFFALLAAWRYYEPNDAYLPLVFSAVGYGLFAAYALLHQRDERGSAELAGWALVTQVLAFGYVIVAPAVGWIRLSMLADAEGFVGTERFEETALYQTAAASVLLVGLLALAQSWLVRRVELAAGASAVLMVALLLEIGHFRPENVQAYTAPLGVYLLVGALLASRIRALPVDARSLIGPLQAVGAVVLMGPTLVQSWEEGGWPYALILFGESLVVLGLALVQRSPWLLAPAVGFTVLDALRYLFDAARVLPNWATVALAGLLLLAAGMAILLGREQWTRWQQMVQAWWKGDPLPSKAK